MNISDVWRRRFVLSPRFGDIRVFVAAIGCLLVEHSHHVFGVANWKTPAQGSDTSSSLALFFSFNFDGSNHKASASRAFSIASTSVPPAEAQPGNSGKTADHRLASGSNSTSRRSFMQAPDGWDGWGAVSAATL